MTELFKRNPHLSDAFDPYDGLPADSRTYTAADIGAADGVQAPYRVEIVAWQPDDTGLSSAALAQVAAANRLRARAAEAGQPVVEHDPDAADDGCPDCTARTVLDAAGPILRDAAIAQEHRTFTAPDAMDRGHLLWGVIDNAEQTVLTSPFEEVCHEFLWLRHTVLAAHADQRPCGAVSRHHPMRTCDQPAGHLGVHRSLGENGYFQVFRAVEEPPHVCPPSQP